MTTFQNGPAKGQTMSLVRTPFFLRVTEDAGKWDALNLPEDKPLPRETLYAYIVFECKGRYHIHASGGRGGWYNIVEYALIPQQPTDETMRSTEKWTAYVEQQAIAMKPYIDKIMATLPKMSYIVNFRGRGRGVPSVAYPKGISICASGQITVEGPRPARNFDIPHEAIVRCKTAFMEETKCFSYHGDKPGEEHFPTVWLGRALPPDVVNPKS